MALQIERLEFWRELREITGRKSEEELASWMIRSGIKDDWLVGGRYCIGGRKAAGCAVSDVA
jgi:hypothetical protein